MFGSVFPKTSPPLTRAFFREVSLRVGWEDLRHIDAVRPALDVHNLAEPTEPELRSAVYGSHRVAHVARVRENVDDLAAFVRYHARQG